MTAAVVNASQRGSTATTLLTDRTKRRKSTRSINHTSAAETHLPPLLSDGEDVVGNRLLPAARSGKPLIMLAEFTVQL